jgi:Na+-translocating ferredoxin:NAD+ oxidoreductase RnfC subunit
MPPAFETPKGNHQQTNRLKTQKSKVQKKLLANERRKSKQYTLAPKKAEDNATVEKKDKKKETSENNNVIFRLIGCDKDPEHRHANRKEV